ncbi:uncharacterized protein [Ptychodera flava]|uniref:uncharacterized protein n=1 Tax=Ptychodera flava TaxID=63121 RepID=UPI00396A02CD
MINKTDDRLGNVGDVRKGLEPEREEGVPSDNILQFQNPIGNVLTNADHEILKDRELGSGKATAVIISKDHITGRSTAAKPGMIFPDANKASIYAVGKNFLLNTTAHGVPRLAASNNFHKRLLWFIIICGSMTAFIVQTCFLVDTFLKYRVTNKITIVTKTSMTFPTVTICNTNKVRRSAIADSPHRDVLVIDDAITLPYYGPCMEGDFMCDDGLLCIKPFLKCDGVRNCIWDGSDELGCEYGTCGDNHFRCANGSQYGFCIEKRLYCDKKKDCYDGEDEVGCECKRDEFQCQDKRGCIAKKQRCNVHFDCDDKSDEKDCPAKDCGDALWCAADDYCILNEFICDGYKDCSDGLDERNCTAEIPRICSSCGCEFPSTSGNFTSPGYPENPKRNIDCNITISVDDGRINMTFSIFESSEDASNSCSQDWIQIRDDISQRTTSKLCNAENITEWISDSSNVTVSIHTGSSGQALVKFLAAYETLPSLNTTMRKLLVFTFK